MKVAIVHYWLVNMRGGEKVLEGLCRVFPEADIYTHVVNREKISPTILQHNIFTTWIAALPFAKKHYQKYLPLMPWALEQLDLRKYDIVISSESGPAKGVLTSPGTLHVCYCHTPMRYLWDLYQHYLHESDWCTRQFLRIFASRMRQWDLASSFRVDHFIANSANVAQRIKKHYRREADVIHPPVDLDFFQCADAAVAMAGGPDAPFIFVGQLVSYKEARLAIQACTLTNRKLLVVGEGKERTAFEKEAGPTISFAGRVNDEALQAALSQARALIFPGEEDFGIVPLEAMACGRPVIAYGKGGALETVRENINGLFFYEQTVESLIAALDDFEKKESQFSAVTIRDSVQSFSNPVFERKIRDTILGLWEARNTL